MNWAGMDPTVRFFWEGRCVLPWHEPRRRIYDCELVYLSEGSFTLRIEEKPHIMTAGSLAIVPPAVWHESRLSPGVAAMRHCIHFDWTRAARDRAAPLMAFAMDPFHPALIRRPPAALADRLPFFASPEKVAPLLPTLNAALEALRFGQALGEALLWPILKLLFSEEAGHPTRMPQLGRAERAILSLKHHIETHYAEPLTYREFCALTQLSQPHLCKIFASRIGCPPTAYLNRIRLQHAQRLLRSGGFTVKQVAADVGIPDPNYFARLFRRHLGLSPHAFAAGG